jgi:putative membrane protein
MHPIRWAMIGFGMLFLIVGSIWFFSSLYRPGFYSGGYYSMPMMGLGGGWMIGAGIIGFVLVCFLVMMALRFTAWGPMGHRMGCGMGWMGGSTEAEEILRQRYARGEVTKEQYDQMLRDLREGRN